MDFYWIQSIDQLERGSFGVLEPRVDQCKKVESFHDSLCVVPCLSCDRKGYRLGYGSGYYDRFLANYRGVTVALCYQEILQPKLMHGKYDVAVDYVVTQQACWSTQRWQPQARTEQNRTDRVPRR